MKDNQLEKSYFDDLTKIKETIRENRYQALVVVNSAMIMTYYKIGTIINERKEWGNKYIQRLAEDLREYGKGYSFENLRRMARFASIFTEDEIWAQPETKIAWMTMIEIISKSSSKEEISRCKNCTTKNGTTKSEQISRSKILTTKNSAIESEKSLWSKKSTLNKSGNLRRQHIKYLPYAFTEQGICMLMTVLKTTNSQN